MGYNDPQFSISFPQSAFHFVFFIFFLFFLLLCIIRFFLLSCCSFSEPVLSLQADKIMPNNKQIENILLYINSLVLSLHNSLYIALFSSSLCLNTLVLDMKCKTKRVMLQDYSPILLSYYSLEK